MVQRILVVSFRYLITEINYYFFFPKKNRFLKILTGITGFSIQTVGGKKTLTGAPKILWIRPLGQWSSISLLNWSSFSCTSDNKCLSQPCSFVQLVLLSLQHWITITKDPMRRTIDLCGSKRKIYSCCNKDSVGLFSSFLSCPVFFGPI